MNVYVVDASVVAKWFLTDNHWKQAELLLSKPNRLHAPDLLFLEVDNVFCKRVRRREFTVADANDARIFLRQLPLQVHPFMSVEQKGFELSSSCCGKG